MDLATKLAEAREHREGREILDLLSQHPSNNKLELDLPLGWKSFVVSKDVQAFRETSVYNEVDPITFQKPRFEPASGSHVGTCREESYPLSAGIEN